MPNHRVEDMEKYRQPVTKRELRAFLDSTGYYRRFVTNFANHSALLTPATSNTAPGKVVWTADMLRAFDNLRNVSVCVHILY